jgi:hypothetical protein
MKTVRDDLRSGGVIPSQGCASSSGLRGKLRAARSRKWPIIAGGAVGLMVAAYFFLTGGGENIPPLIGAPVAFIAWVVSLCLGTKSEAVAFLVIVFALPLVCIMFGALAGLALSCLATALKHWRGSTTNKI